jgi:hypothetical protein
VKKRITAEFAENTEERRERYVTRIRMRGYPHTDSRDLSSVFSAVNLFFGLWVLVIKSRITIMIDPNASKFGISIYLGQGLV